MAKDPQITLLFDFYGNMLTDKQQDMVDQYYNQDLSLSEIAENAGISRQGVRDSVKRAESQLLEMEDRLGFCALVQRTRAALQTIAAEASGILEAPYNAQVSRRAERIASLAAELSAD